MNECEHILNLLVLINFLFLFSSVGVKNYKKAFFLFLFFLVSQSYYYILSRMNGCSNCLRLKVLLRRQFSLDVCNNVSSIVWYLFTEEIYFTESVYNEASTH